MPESTEKLRGLLGQIRDDLAVLSAITEEGRPPSSEPPRPPQDAPAPESQVPLMDMTAADYSGLAADLEVPDVEERLPERRPAWRARGLLDLAVPVAQAACLGLAAAGAWRQWPELLAGGLAGLAAASLLGPLTPRASRDRLGRELEDRLGALERRIEHLAYSAETGALSKDLEEDIRELRRVVLSLVKSVRSP